MGTELIGPVLWVICLLLALLAASFSSALFSQRHSLLSSTVFGLCVGVVAMLVSSSIAWMLAGSPVPAL
jgi:hypothetical protein